MTTAQKAHQLCGKMFNEMVDAITMSGKLVKIDMTGTYSRMRKKYGDNWWELMSTADRFAVCRVQAMPGVAKRQLKTLSFRADIGKGYEKMELQLQVAHGFSDGAGGELLMDHQSLRVSNTPNAKTRRMYQVGIVSNSLTAFMYMRPNKLIACNFMGGLEEMTEKPFIDVMIGIMSGIRSAARKTK